MDGFGIVAFGGAIPGGAMGRLTTLLLAMFFVQACADEGPCVLVVYTLDGRVLIEGEKVPQGDALDARLAELARRDPQPDICLSVLGDAQREAGRAAVENVGLSVREVKILSLPPELDPVATGAQG